GRRIPEGCRREVAGWLEWRRSTGMSARMACSGFLTRQRCVARVAAACAPPLTERPRKKPTLLRPLRHRYHPDVRRATPIQPATERANVLRSRDKTAEPPHLLPERLAF